MRHTTFRIAVGLSLLSTALSCKTGEQSATQDATSTNSATTTAPFPLEPNDVSILFPAPETNAEVAGMQKLKALGIVDEQTFLDFQGKSHWLTPDGHSMSTATTLDQLSVVALRFDACFRLTVKPLSACLPQLRLVVQPILPNSKASGTPTLHDSALHLSFGLDDAATKELARTLVTLKNQDTTTPQGLPLRVHPRLERERSTGDFAKSLTAIMKNYCSPQNLQSVAFMAFDGFRTNWKFGIAFIDPKTKTATLAPLPSLPGTTFTQQELVIKTVSHGFTNLPNVGSVGKVPNFVPISRLVKPTPEGPAIDNLTFLFDSDNFFKADAYDAGMEQDPKMIAAVKSIYNIANPNLHTPRSIDCVSCHEVQPYTQYLAKRGFNFATADLEAARYHAPTGINATVELNKDYDKKIYSAQSNSAKGQVDNGTERWNTLNFGLFTPPDNSNGNNILAPSISPRTVNETAEVINYLRQHPEILKDGK